MKPITKHICWNCKKEFKTFVYRTKFCSAKCNSKYRYQQKKYYGLFGYLRTKKLYVSYIPGLNLHLVITVSNEGDVYDNFYTNK